MVSESKRVKQGTELMAGSNILSILELMAELKGKLNSILHA